MCNVVKNLVIPIYRDIKLKTPFVVQEGKRELHHTYLDTVGRPVVVAHKQNLVEQHIQEFEVLEHLGKIGSKSGQFCFGKHGLTVSQLPSNAKLEKCGGLDRLLTENIL